MKKGAAGGFISGELDLIEAIRERAQAGRRSRGLRLGIGDDCAVLRPSPGYEVVVTTDFSLEGRHFRREWHPPQSVGHRCLARGLSDLAAMGAEPLGVFLSLAIPPKLPAGWVEGFLDGLMALAERHRVPLAGGDTAESPAGESGAGLIALDIVAVGQVQRGKGLLRSGARVGDGIYVTGALGGAAAELLALSRNPRRFRGLRSAEAGHPHLYPEPRLEVGQRIRKVAHAAIDLSDGLSTDLTHLCRASGLGAEIEEEAIPIHALAREAERAGLTASPLELALHGGEDYELLFSTPAGRKIPRTIKGIPIHRIGRMVPRTRGQALMVLRNRRGELLPFEAGGWEHFR